LVDVVPVLVVLLAGLLAVAVGMGAAAVRARKLDKAAVVDVAWGAGFVLIALAAALVSTALDEGTAWRRWLVLALVAVWGLRLAWHIRGRAVGEHQGREDPRYAEMLGGPPSQIGMRTVVRRVFLVQGAVQWFVAGPVMLGAVLTVAWWPVVVVGVLVWATGFFFEAVGDRQLAAYKAQPREARPQVMDQGLWRYTRHPNYFGDACLWWGIWMIAGLGSGWLAGLATVACPAAMTYFVYQVTGAKLLEKTMRQRPGYPEYAARTSIFIPLPPRG
jgi:steroid 5-alpha reductase family enzyme